MAKWLEVWARRTVSAQPYLTRVVRAGPNSVRDAKFNYYWRGQSEVWCLCVCQGCLVGEGLPPRREKWVRPASWPDTPSGHTARWSDGG